MTQASDSQTVCHLCTLALLRTLFVHAKGMTLRVLLRAACCTRATSQHLHEHEHPPFSQVDRAQVRNRHQPNTRGRCQKHAAIFSSSCSHADLFGGTRSARVTAAAFHRALGDDVASKHPVQPVGAAGGAGAAGGTTTFSSSSLLSTNSSKSSSSRPYPAICPDLAGARATRGAMRIRAKPCG